MSFGKEYKKMIFHEHGKENHFTLKRQVEIIVWYHTSTGL